MRRRFFVERFDGDSAVLRGDAAHHLRRVLRAKPGQLYELSDGTAAWLARTERVTRDAVELSLVELLPSRQPRLRVAVLLAIVKFEPFEWSLEKATELGVDEIVPLAAARSEKALVAAAGKRAARWQKILHEAAEQARRLRPPTLRAVTPPRAGFLSAGAQHAVRLLLSERQEAPLLRTILERKSGSSAALAIGPEGGWTDDELRAAREAGFAEASLGANILRTETAVVAALAAVNYALGD